MLKAYRSIFLILILCGCLWSGPGNTAPLSNAQCLTCHSSEANVSEKFRINEKNFLGSAHGRLNCTDCHIIRPGEAEGDVPHKKALPDVNCTATCHRDAAAVESGTSPLSYPDSVHGRAYLERGVKEVARCWDCHGKHNILPASNPESSVNRKNIPRTCSACHEDMHVVVKYNIHKEMPYHEYVNSVHGKALFEKGLVQFAAVCTDCHGVHNIQGVGAPHLMARQPQTCGRCHELIFEKYKRSIHGQQALAGNADAPLCIDCHGEHGIASPKEDGSPTSPEKVLDTCSTCHARPEIMKKYGIPPDRIATFIDSMHGIAIGFGYKAAANCTSCHGVHDILPASNPQSKVNPANLRETCGQPKCHPNMPEKIASAKIHIGAEEKRPAVLYYIQRFLLVLVVLVLVITVLWFVPGFVKKTKLFKK
jgi:hypothetical protein